MPSLSINSSVLRQSYLDKSLMPAGEINYLQKVLTPLSDLIGGGLDVVDMVAEVPELHFGLFEFAPGDFSVLELLGPELVLR